MRAHTPSAHTVCSGGFAVLRTLPGPLALLLLLLVLAAPAQATIYVDRKDDNTLFLTNDRRKAGQEQAQPSKAEPSAAAETPAHPETVSESAPQTPPDTAPRPPGTLDLDEAVLPIVQELQQGFSEGQTQRIAQLFNYFPQKASPTVVLQQKGRVQAFLDLFFKTFGTLGRLDDSPSSGEKLHLSRIYGAFASEVKTVDCDWRHESFTAPLRNAQSSVALQMSICLPQGADAGSPWIKDLGVGILDPSPELAAEVATFKETYRQRMREAAQAAAEATAEQKPKAAAPEDTTPQPTTPEPAPQPQPQPQAQPQPAAPSQPDGGFGTLPEMQQMGDMQDISMLLGFFSGTFITAMLVVSLFFYMLYCLSLHIIARKLDVPHVWMAWVPVLQTHPMVLSAGLPGWVTLLIILSFLLAAIPVVGALVSLGVLVLVIYLWMRICERLGTSKWLALLLLVPLAQFLLPAWLAFKNDALRFRVDVGGLIRKSILALLLLAALSWALTTYLIMPAMQPLLAALGGLQQNMPAQMEQMEPMQLPSAGTSQPAAEQPATGQPRTSEASGPQQPVFSSLSREQYEELLAGSRAPEVETGQSRPQAYAGPALLRLDSFWEDPQAPHVWIKVLMPPLPNLNLGNAGRIVISSVQDTSGAEVYDSENSFEKGQFQELSFHEMQWQTPRLEAIRDVHLDAGVTESSLRAVSGEMVLELPLDIQALDFSAEQAGSNKQFKGVAITLKDIDGKEASLTISGEMQNHVATLAYDSQGTLLDQQFSSWNTVGDTKNITYGFEEPVQRLQVLVSSGVLRKVYPFTLQAP